MTYSLYSIRDKVAMEFGPIFQAKNEGVALRMLGTQLKESPTMNPAEYELICIGTFNSDTGAAHLLDVPISYTGTAAFARADYLPGFGDGSLKEEDALLDG